MDDQNTQDPQIQDGVIIEETEVEVVTPAAEGDAVILLNLESLIKSHLVRIDKLSRELKEQQDTLNNILLNDQTYKVQDDQAKEANKIKMATKAQIMKRPDVAHVGVKIKEMREELKEKRDDLAGYLPEYQRMSGSTEIEDEDGTLLQIVNNPKLVRAGSKFK